MAEPEGQREKGHGDADRPLSFRLSGGSRSLFTELLTPLRPPSQPPGDRLGSSSAAARCARPAEPPKTQGRGGGQGGRQCQARARWPGRCREQGPALARSRGNILALIPTPSLPSSFPPFPPAWQGVCAVSCLQNRPPVSSGPPHTRPSSLLPPSCLLPPREVGIFPMILALLRLSQLLLAPCRPSSWARWPSPGARGPGGAEPASEGLTGSPCPCPRRREDRGPEGSARLLSQPRSSRPEPGGGRGCRPRVWAAKSCWLLPGLFPLG